MNASSPASGNHHVETSIAYRIQDAEINRLRRENLHLRSDLAEVQALLAAAHEWIMQQGVPVKPEEVGAGEGEL